MEPPFTKQYYTSVDEETGVCIKCSISNSTVKVCTNHPFSLAEWLRHVNKSSTYTTSVLNKQKWMHIAAKLKNKDPTLSYRNKLLYHWISMAASKMTNVFKAKPKIAAPKSDGALPQTASGKLWKVVYEGIFPNFCQIKDEFNFGSLLTTYGCYHVISDDSDSRWEYVYILSEFCPRMQSWRSCFLWLKSPITFYLFLDSICSRAHKGGRWSSSSVKVPSKL